MSDTWDEIQNLKNKQTILREKLLKRKKEREGLVAGITGAAKSSAKKDSVISTAHGDSSQKPVITKTPSSSSSSLPATSLPTRKTNVSTSSTPVSSPPSKKPKVSIILGAEYEKKLLLSLVELGLDLPFDGNVLIASVLKDCAAELYITETESLLEKFAAQNLITIERKDEKAQPNKTNMVVTFVDHAKVDAMTGRGDSVDKAKGREKEKLTDDSKQQQYPAKKEDSIESLLSMQSAKEKEDKKLSEEILELLAKPTTKEQSLMEKFKSQGGTQVKEFCPFGTKEECKKLRDSQEKCKKLHFKKILHRHTDDSLGDCSFLNTCFHMDTCKYVHYEIDQLDHPARDLKSSAQTVAAAPNIDGEKVTLIPAQWVSCDIRALDFNILGKFSVIMADPPWDIHMELPYGTMADDEMRKLNIPALQDDGYIFLWVTGRAMELGRECLTLWGYERCDELIWVKTNQLQRIIRTGRTGHWFNHGKEHCLIGVKGNPKNMNRGLDCDVLVAEVRATSHKPDEVYGMIERLSPGTRKIELFGRPHNVQPNWVTLGNQLDGVRLVEPDVVRRFKKRYPDGNVMPQKK